MQAKNFRPSYLRIMTLVTAVIVTISALVVGASTSAPVVPKVYPYTSFWWQLEGTLNPTGLVGEVNPRKHYDFDFEDITTSKINTIHAQGALVTCYFEVGTKATWRDDANSFPPAAVASTAPQGWSDERWVDITNPGVGAVMAARMDVSKAKGCDGIEPDWLDSYTYTQQEYDSGNKIHPPTIAQELVYMRFLADQAHQRGMAIALKNVPDMAVRNFADGVAVADVFDWALSEECLTSYNSECANYATFISRNKNVTVAEYNDQVSQTRFTTKMCPKLLGWNYDAYLFDRKNGSSPTLTGKFRIPCRTGVGGTTTTTSVATTTAVPPTTTVTTTTTTTTTTVAPTTVAPTTTLSPCGTLSYPLNS